MSVNQLFVTAEVGGSVERNVLMGREFLVVPATLVRNQVLNNNLGRTLLPEEAMTQEWAETFNGAPVLIDHPTRQGQPITGRDPAIINEMGIGFVFHSRIAQKDDVATVQAKVYIDPDRADEVGDLETILEKIENGEPVELSTGFPVMAEERSGVHNGEEYDLVLYPKGADHLAVFAEKRGACSVEDGCGVLNEEDTDEVERWFAAFVRKLAVNQSDSDRRNLLHMALVEVHGSDGVHIWVEDVFSDEGVVVYEMAGDEEHATFRAPYEISDDGSVTLGDPERVRKVTSYEPVTLETGADSEKENIMNREAMIAALEESGLDRESLEAMNDCQIRALHDATVEEGTGAEGEEPTGQEPNQEEEGEQGAEPTRSDSEAVEAILAEIREENKQLRTEVQNLQKAVEPAVQEQERERSTLIQALASNDEVPFDEGELKAKGIDELRKLARMARGHNYALRGGPKSYDDAANGEDEAFIEPTPYYATQEGDSSGEEA